ncbi:MAG: methyltransferase domain-containing protein [Proteobacteria bacterium]|nr:methyltransferase domain-containing protein [Pseudomonadota bacterium]
MIGIARIRHALERRSGRIAGRLLSRVLRLPVFKEAVWQALCADAKWTPQPNLAIAGEILRRVRAIQDPNGANRYLPERWRLIFLEIRAAVARHVDWTKSPVFLNFGAGDRNPMALPLLFALAGAGRSYALEPGRLRHEVTTVTLQETLWDVACDPSRYGLAAGDLARLAAAVDAGAFRRGGPLEEVLRGGTVGLLATGGENLDLPPESIDLVYSRSTLEHVLDIEAAMVRLVGCLKIGGVMYHDIGLDAHDTGDPVAFYYAERVPQVDRFADLNFLRLSDFVRLFERLGCAVEIVQRDLLAAGALRRERLIERFRAYGDDDLRTIGAKLLVRRLK